MSTALESVPDRAVLPAGLQGEVERRIAGGQLALPMLPHVASEILAGGMNESADIRELSDLLHRDQALAGHVLRVANSAAYGGAARIQSIQQALIRIGLTQMREIVVAVALQSGVFRLDVARDLVADLWRHSAIAGLYAKEVARRLRANVEGAFVCGLLHDVGKPVVLALVLDLVRDTGVSVPGEVCVATLDHYHTRIGRILADQWSLPEPVLESIAHHHDPEAAAQHGQAVRITCLADRLAHVALAAEDHYEAESDGLRSHPVCGALNLYPEDVDELLEKRTAVLELAEAFGS